MKIAIIGAGTWGVVVASYLSKKNNEVTVYHRNSEESKELESTNFHPNLSSKNLSSTLNYSSDIKSAQKSDLCILAVPTHSLSAILEQFDDTDIKYLVLSKGFDINTGLLPTQLLNEQYNIDMINIAVLSGPNHAEEIVDGKSATTVISSTNDSYAKELQTLFSSQIFRVYTSSDILGVQIGGAIKNVIAIASGICDGLNLGDNTQAALVSRGLNEILELSKVYDFNNKTLYGLSGVGDLVGTCYSKHSRNRQLGVLLGEGKTLNKAKKIINMVSEGVNTTMILHSIILNNNLKMPICMEIYNILFKDCNPNESINKLMTRKLTKESY